MPLARLSWLPLIWISLTLAPWTAQAFTIRVSPESAATLTKLSETLGPVVTEFQVECNPETSGGSSLCQIQVNAVSETPLLEELISHPLNPDAFIAYRVTRGSDAFRSRFYQAVGRFSETHAYAENVFERRLDLENDQFRIRCIRDETKPKSPFHHCWVIVGAQLFAEILN